VLLDKLPDDSEFKKASERDGRQTRAERVAEEHYNETALLRASFFAVHGGKDAAYEPDLLLDPIDEQRQAERDAAAADEATQARAEFEAQISPGWTQL
jgi:hypothetical protein